MRVTLTDKLNNATIQRELSNAPRIDLDRRRHGNTLTDDMIAIKNPRSGSTHLDNSLLYNNVPFYDDTYINLPTSVNFGTNSTPTNTSDRLISRKKHITERAGDIFTEDGLYDGTPMEDVMAEYEKMLIDRKERRASRNNEDIRSDVRYLRSGGNTYHDPGEQMPRWDSEWDPAVNANVDYSKLSPAQLNELVKMGVNRPESEELMNFIHLYEYYLNNLKGK